MKGIILSGGKGTRLYPNTAAVSKQLLPVYSKPMIYYALTNIILTGITEILVITNPENIKAYQDLLGTGDWCGVSIEYLPQPEPKGIAEALILAEEWLNGDRVMLHLGDNILYGFKLPTFFRQASMLGEGCIIFTTPVKNPQDYGVVEIGEDGKISAVIEKPINPKSNLAIPGIYFFDSNASKLAKTLLPSPRGELEITDLVRLYLQNNKLLAIQLSRGMVWMDAGTWESLLDASMFIKTIEEQSGVMIGCPEEASLRVGSIKSLDIAISHCSDGRYKEYLRNINKEGKED